MNVQPKPAIDLPCLPGAREGADRPMPRGRVPVAEHRQLFTWPVEFEVEPWRP